MHRLLSSLHRLLRAVFLGLIFVYQRLISPALTVVSGSGCRFHPTCSEFARQAVVRYGLPRGGLMTVRRLSRCHPFHPGGYDPPELRS
jgi:putative membrane protein insertion efficiency factor